MFIHKRKDQIPQFFDDLKAKVTTYRRARSDERYRIECIVLTMLVN